MVTYSTYSDQKLSDLLKSGDYEAFTQIYNRYAPTMLHHAYNKLRNREDPRDYVQEIFSNLWSNRETQQIKTNLSGFLYTSLRNLILNQLSHQKVENKYFSSMLHFVNTEQVIPDHYIREKQLKEHIEKEISALPPKMREVFELSRKENLSHKEIARRLNITEQTASKHISNAKKILGKKFDEFLILMILAGL